MFFAQLMKTSRCLSFFAIMCLCSAFIQNTHRWKNKGILAAKPDITVANSALKRSASQNLKKQPILFCPAQLSIPNDYEEMAEIFNSKGQQVYIPELSRKNWILGLLPSVFTLAYLKGTLLPEKTLKFYYDAIDKALEKLKMDSPDQPFHVVGHSIGGWIARGWLNERLSKEDKSLVLSLTTLGTPNRDVLNDNMFASVEQTRGLLKYINENYPAGSLPNIKYTSIVGTGTKASLTSFNLQEILAFISYLPLGGSPDGLGDGIVPWKVGIMKGSESVLLPNAKHSGFLPFFGKLSAAEFPWYGDSETIEEWSYVLDRAEKEYKMRKKNERFTWSFGMLNK